MKSKQDILTAFREHLDTLMLIASCQPKYFTEEQMKADNKISIDKFLEQTVTPTLTEFEREKEREMIEKIRNKRKEVWRFYHEAQLWSEQKEAVKPYDDILSELEKEKRT